MSGKPGKLWEFGTQNKVTTLSHHSMMMGKHFESFMSMLLTILLGIYFTLLQVYEYFEASFCISDSIYGSSFFMATGFHGIHVVIGTTFTCITCMMRQVVCHFSKIHHFGFEPAAWYWHFVDMWLFHYISIYWWGG